MAVINVTGQGDNFIDDLLGYTVTASGGQLINTLKLGLTDSFNGTGVDLATENVNCITPGPSGCVNSGSAFQITNIGPAGNNTQQNVVPPQSVLNIATDISSHSNTSGVATVTNVANEFVTGASAGTPEPASIILIASGFLGLGLLRRRKSW